MALLVGSHAACDLPLADECLTHPARVAVCVAPLVCCTVCVLRDCRTFFVPLQPGRDSPASDMPDVSHCARQKMLTHQHSDRPIGSVWVNVTTLSQLVLPAVCLQHVLLCPVGPLAAVQAMQSDVCARVRVQGLG